MFMLQASQLEASSYFIVTLLSQQEEKVII